METNSKRRALGRGLEELFNNEPIDIEKVEEKIIEETPKDQIVELELSSLRANPYQPRKVFDQEKLQELSESIKTYGVVQPIIVKKSVKGYEIIAGERRFKASALAGLEKIPAIIKDFTDSEMMEIAVLENLQRENLNPLEEAEAYEKLLTTLKITHEELGRRLGKSRTYITNTVGLLKLPEQAKTYVMEEKITMGHARALSKIESNEDVLNLIDRIVNERISVRETEDIVASGDFKKKNPMPKKKKTNEYKYVEESLFEKLGTKVKIKEKKIVISFENTNDLNRILELLGLTTE